MGYPIGLEGVVVGQGDTYEEALADVKSAIRFHIKTFGSRVIRISEIPTREDFLKAFGAAEQRTFRQPQAWHCASGRQDLASSLDQRSASRRGLGRR